MKKLCVAIGVAALFIGLANAAQIEPAGVKAFHEVKGVTHVGPSIEAAQATANRAPAYIQSHRTMDLGHGGSGGITRVNDLVYDNTTTAQGFGTTVPLGGHIGDDLHMDGGGSLEGFAFSLWNSPDSTANLTAVDVVWIFRDTEGNDIGGFYATGLPVQDPNDPNDVGLMPGYAQFWTLSGLDDPNDPNSVVELPYTVTAIAGFSNPVPAVGIDSIGQVTYDPPTVGYSWDRFWYDEDPNDPNAVKGWYLFTDDPNDPNAANEANFFWQITLDKTIEPPAAGYSCITNSSGYATADFDSAVFGDDIKLTSGGTVESVQFSLVHFAWGNICGYSAGNMLGCDIDISFADINDPVGNVYGTVLTDNLDWSADPLPTGYGYTYTYTGLDSVGLVLTAQTNVIMQKTYNFSSQGNPQYSQLGPFIYENTGNPPDVGSSEDTFWFDDTGSVFPADYGSCDSGGGTIWGATWLWFNGVIKADFYYAVGLINPIPFTITATTQPEIPGDAGSFELDPADDFGTGGIGNPVEADGSTQLTYTSGQIITYLQADVNSLAGHQFIKFMCRALEGPALDEQFDGPTHFDTNGLFIATDFNAIEMVFDNTIAFYALDDGVPASKNITISEYGGGAPVLDLDGQGAGNTPFTRRYDPMMDAADYPDANGNYPYEWVLLTAEDPGSDVLEKWVLTQQDGTQTELEMTEGDLDINIRLDAFTEAYAIYIPGEHYLCGDANGDEVADVFDIDAFVVAITNDEAGFLLQFPGVNYLNSDTNCDGDADVFDIDTFVGAITGTVCDCGY